MGYFNNNYANYPNVVSNMIQQVKYDALKIGAGLPFATMFGGGVLAQAAVAPEMSAVVGASYHGAMLSVALQANKDMHTGEVSSPKQYYGTAVFGILTGPLTEGRGVVYTAGVTGLAAAAENWALDGSVQPKQVAANTFGAAVGNVAGQAFSSVPVLRPFAGAMRPAVESVVTYGATAVTTAAIIKSEAKH